MGGLVGSAGCVHCPQGFLTATVAIEGKTMAYRKLKSIPAYKPLQRLHLPAVMTNNMVSCVEATAGGFDITEWGAWSLHPLLSVRS